eukprot:gb/GEZJ01006637.1/.p1 GENE.gb/GEZJ01006637.1/~~gb/GEZJ01006637.1/.p1  ORF type:complete len:116 (+),score=3.37 gb/GEZJ01006637.1/:198-545(+)
MDSQCRFNRPLQFLAPLQHAKYLQAVPKPSLLPYSETKIHQFLYQAIQQHQPESHVDLLFEADPDTTCTFILDSGAHPTHITHHIYAITSRRKPIQTQSGQYINRRNAGTGEPCK